MAKIWTRTSCSFVVEILEQRDGDRIGLLAGRAGSAHPDAHGGLPLLALEEAREDLGAQRLERIVVAKEVGDADEHVLVQRAQLASVGLDQLEVVPEAFDLVQEHAPLGAALDRRQLVLAEVGARSGADEPQELGEILALVRRLGDGGGMIGVRAERHELGRDRLRRSGEVDAASGERRARHAGVLRRRDVLREGQPAGLLDRLDAERAVGAGAGVDDADGVLAQIGGERAQKRVDLQPRACSAMAR